MPHCFLDATSRTSLYQSKVEPILHKNGRDIFGVEVLSDRLVNFSSATTCLALDVKSVMTARYLSVRYPCLSIFVNVEQMSIAHEGAMIASIARRGIVFEVTERSFNRDKNFVVEFAEQVRKNGAQIALDDVPSVEQYRSFIEAVRPDYLKADKRDLAVDLKSAFPQTPLILERVETSLDYVQAVMAEANLMQGFYFWKNDLAKRRLNEGNIDKRNCPDHHPILLPGSTNRSFESVNRFDGRNAFRRPCVERGR